MIANIASDDGLILPHSANPAGSNIRERHLPYRRFVGVLTDANARLGADVDRSGRIEARTGLRMMPTSPRSPLSFRTAGFSRYGWEGGLFDGGLPIKWPTLGFSRPAPVSVLVASIPLVPRGL